MKFKTTAPYNNVVVIKGKNNWDADEYRDFPKNQTVKLYSLIEPKERRVTVETKKVLVCPYCSEEIVLTVQTSYGCYEDRTDDSYYLPQYVDHTCPALEEMSGLNNVIDSKLSEIEKIRSKADKEIAAIERVMDRVIRTFSDKVSDESYIVKDGKKYKIIGE